MSLDHYKIDRITNGWVVSMGSLEVPIEKWLPSTYAETIEGTFLIVKQHHDALLADAAQKSLYG